MKFLVIRFSSIGDIVLTTPVVRCLKKQLPHVELHYITKPPYKSIVENNTYTVKFTSAESMAKGVYFVQYAGMQKRTIKVVK